MPGVLSSASHDAPHQDYAGDDLEPGQSRTITDEYEADEIRDFGVFLSCLSELGYGYAWASVDAQYFGLAQRRERVFLVGYSGRLGESGGTGADVGTAAHAATVQDLERFSAISRAVLFDLTCMSGDSPPSRESGERVAGTIGARTKGGGGLGTDLECDGGTVAAFSPTSIGGYGEGVGTLRANGGDLGGGSETLIIPPVSFALNESGRFNVETETIVPTRFGLELGNQGSGGNVGWFDADGPARTLDTNCPPGIAEISPTLRSASDSPAAHNKQNGTDREVLIPVAFKASHYTRGKDGSPSETVPPLSADADKGDQDTLVASVAFQEAQTGCREYDTSGTLRSNGPGHDPVGTRVRSGMAVRRLTPRECEYLQLGTDYGDYTKVPFRGKPMADGNRYKMLGNSWAVPCVEWIFRRMDTVDKILEAEK